MTARPVRAVVYLRVSTETQLDGYGLDIQEKACRAYAEALGWEIVGVYEDGAVSGTLPAHERPGLADALELLADDGADVALAARLDRLARELVVQEAILAQVWAMDRHVHTTDMGEIKRDDPDDPMRTAMRQMAGVFAQLERAMIAKRLRDGRRIKAANGGKGSGSYPYGWSRDGEVPAEQRVLVRMLDRSQRGWTLAQVADDLNGAGLRTRHDRPWTVGTVGNVLRRARRVGERAEVPS